MVYMDNLRHRLAGAQVESPAKLGSIDKYTFRETMAFVAIYEANALTSAS